MKINVKMSTTNKLIKQITNTKLFHLTDFKI